MKKLLTLILIFITIITLVYSSNSWDMISNEDSKQYVGVPPVKVPPIPPPSNSR